MDTSILTFSFPAESNKAVRVIMRDGEPWFVAKDVCDVLEQPNISQVVSRLDDDEKGLHNVETLGGQQEMSIINESGLYSLILTSRKPEAKAFKRWVTHEVLPSIRKTGSYQLNEPPPRESMETINTADQEAIARIVWLIAGRFHFKGMAKHAIYTGIRRQYGLKNSYKTLPTCYLNDCYTLLKQLDSVASRFAGMMYEHEKRFYHRVFRNLIPLDAAEFDRMFEQELTRIAIENRKTADLLEYFRPKPDGGILGIH